MKGLLWRGPLQFSVAYLGHVLSTDIMQYGP